MNWLSIRIQAAILGIFPWCIVRFVAEENGYEGTGIVVIFYILCFASYFTLVDLLEKEPKQ